MLTRSLVSRLALSSVLLVSLCGMAQAGGGSRPPPPPKVEVRSAGRAVEPARHVERAPARTTEAAPKVYGAAPSGFRTPAGPALHAPEQKPNIALGLPTPRPELYPHATVVSRRGFVSVFDPDRKIPLVVSWATTPKDLGPAKEAWTEREDVFHEDTELGLPQASLLDYRGSGYHRGHMVRQGERPLSIDRAANQSTFSMVNILPQSKNNNLGPWGHFEDFYRDFVFETKKVAYIQAGPVLEGSEVKIGAGGVVVPSHTYKIVVFADEGVDLKTVKPEDIGSKVKVLAVIIPNNDRDVQQGDHWARYAVPVSQVAKRTNHPGFIAGFSEETRKAAWNHRPEIKAVPHADGQAFEVDGMLAKPWVQKEYKRDKSPKAAAAE